MDKLLQINEMLQKGRTKAVVKLIQEALDEGTEPKVILEELLNAMNEVGIKFKNEEYFVPEVLIAARAMNKGVELLKPLLKDDDDNQVKGKVVLGTVKGDQHDIGKNLVRIMLEGKGIEVVDLGIDVSAEKFVEEAINHKVDIICCSALLTTTMSEMRRVVELVKEKNLDVKVMIGGAPVNQEFCDEIGADFYTDEATSASEAAVKILLERGK